MTCAKARVKATLLTLDSETFEGENTCENPQASCPRGPGEGYEKCKTVCKQDAHAEIRAIEACYASGGDPAGGSMTVDYHHVCPACSAVMVDLGIRYVHKGIA